MRMSSEKDMTGPSAVVPRQGSASGQPAPSRRSLLVSLAIAATVVLAFWPVAEAGFVRFDDQDYVFENQNVVGGLNLRAIHWAFTTFHAQNWHPLTWLSLMLDAQLIGLDPAVFHIHNVLLHAANSVLVFLVLRLFTGAFWRPALVAAFFALHPSHVESVAWVSERKDVLSTFFFMLTIGAYGLFARSRSNPAPVGALSTSASGGFASRASSNTAFAAVVVCYAMGLLAKPMVLTLPAVLLLLDYWPLRRWSKDSARELIREKWPLFALTLASALVTVLVQSRGGAVRTLEQYPLPGRLANAAVSYVRYLGMTVWPVDLSVLYPHPGTWPVWAVVGCFGLLLGLTFLAWRGRVAHGYAWVGWCWFLGTLVPVIGVVQVGIQAMADRYVYIPHIGLFVGIVWAAHAFAKKKRELLQTCAGAALLMLACCFVLTRQQSAIWRNDETLFTHAIQVTRNNALAHSNLADFLLRTGRAGEAIPHFREVIRLNPKLHHAHNNLAAALNQSGQPAQAVEHARRALELNPDYALSYANLGDALWKLGKPAEAEAAYQRAVSLDPTLAGAWNNWGGVLAQQKRPVEAADKYSRALSADPALAPALLGLARSTAEAAQQTGDNKWLETSAAAYGGALAAMPGVPNLQVEYAQVLLAMGRTNDALRELTVAVMANPQHTRAQQLLRSISSGITAPPARAQK